MAKFYFGAPHDEFCHPVEYWEQQMEDHDIDKLILIPAKPMHGAPFFFCQYHQEPFERGEAECGAQCKGYKPRNGRSGICQHWRVTYEPDADNTVTIPRE